MNEKFNKNAKVEQLTKMFLSLGEEKGLIVKDPLNSERATTEILHWRTEPGHIYYQFIMYTHLDISKTIV